MKTIKVNLKKRSYRIIIGANIIKLLGNYIKALGIGNSAYIITNAPVKNKYGKALNKALRKSGIYARFALIPDSEKSKSMEMASLLIKGVAAYDKRKQIFIIALGGGVTGDLSGFIASIYKRGIPYIQIPTTLLAQVDSAIGGKTAVDLAEGKNLAGAFYQPRLVFSDVATLKTLDLRQLRCGLAEAIKYGIIKDPRLFAYLEKKYKDILRGKISSLEFVVERSSAIKAKIVQQDEKEEKGLRTILNFGHTLGHAIEAAGNYKKYNHGEAVALGMLLASDLSRRLGLADNITGERVENLIKATGLPTRIEKTAMRDIINAHYRDKKFIGTQNKFVLIESIGKTRIVKNIPLKLIKEALRGRI